MARARSSTAWRSVWVLLVVAAPTLAAGACSGTTGTDGTVAGSTASAPGTTLPRLADIAALRDALVGAGITCELEYESLRDEGKALSLCVIDGDRATLTIWDDPEVLAAFVAAPSTGTGVTVYGQNWSIDLQHAAVARRVADALGGQVKGTGT